MAVYKRDIVDINLETGNIHRSFLKHSIGYKDQKADHFGIRTFRDGVPVDLTGVSVQGIFMPPQGDPIAITSGNIVSGNVAEVVLPQACYNYDGQFCLAIKLVDSNNSVTGTMRIVDGMVDNTHASGTVAPTSAVPTYQEILSTYDAMVAATAAANGAIAATYSSSSTYKVGDYCIHDGGLYRCTTAITTAEAWTSGHWTAAKIGPDVSELKSAITNQIDPTLSDLVYVTKNIFDKTAASSDGTVIKTNGTEGTYSNWSCTGFMPVNSRYLYIRKGATNVTTLCAFYSSNSAESFIVYYPRTSLEVSQDGTNYIVPVPETAKYVRANFKTSELNVFMVCPWFYPSSYSAYNVDYYRPLPDGAIPSNILRDDEQISVSNIPDTIQRVTDNTLQTTAKTVVGAINELYNGGGGGGGGGGTPPWVLSPSGSDDTTAIVSALTSYGYCKLAKGTFSVSNIDMPEGSTLDGMGYETKLLLSGSDSDAGYAVKMASRCTVQNLSIWGASSDITIASSLVNRHGILWEGTYDTTPSATQPQRGTVHNVHIRNFKGGGITCRNTGTPTQYCLNVSDCYINGCRAGINIAYSSEFHRFVNVHCGGCYYGCINNGGNNTFVNCGFSLNKVGFVIGSSDGKSIEPSSTQHVLSNLAHGSVVGCVFNHIDSDSTTLGKGDAIRIIGSTAGFVFDGCQFFYSKINIQDANAIMFGDCLFGENRNDQGVAGGYGITLTNTDAETRKTFFNNCVFKRQPVFTKTNSGTGTIAPIINACYLHDGTAVTDS